MAALGFGMSMSMGQRMDMVMTPQMIQSMEMLQLPLLALEQKISQELMENPALELAEMKDASALSEADAEGDDSGEVANADATGEGESEDLRRVDDVDYDWDDFYGEGSPRRSSSDDERFDIIENTAGPAMGFQEYLESQLAYCGLDERARVMCRQIIFNLDDKGYLPVPLEEAVDPEQTPPPQLDELEAALAIVQRLDPPGVAARDARECLLLQIDALGNGDHAFERELVEKHLEDLAANRLPQIARALGHDVEAVKKAALYIRTLNPHPGLEFGSRGTTHIVPDVIVNIDESGVWEIRLANGSQPDISDTFLALFDTTKRGRQLREEIEKDPERAAEFKQMRELVKNGSQGKVFREKYQAARWLVVAVAQRERTLLRVAQAVINVQKEYLSGREDAPRPLMMQAIADEIGVDISTVSRAAREKYIHTPIGVKPLRMFFTRDVGGRGGKAGNSNEHIMNRIREIIETEDKKKPLKDDQIEKLLATEGISIKRRTVAKYRTNLGFLNHSQRREY